MQKIPRDEELEEILARCSKSLKAHCLVFHPSRFTRPFSYAHDKLFEVYDDRSIQKLLVVAHRGFGKTSIFNYAVPSQAIIHRLAKFIVPTSATSTHALIQSENLKYFLTTDEVARSIVGDIRSDKFSQEMWRTSFGTTVLPRGYGQQIRGQIIGDSRMDLGIVDDLETPEIVASKEQRDKLKSWFFTDFMLAVNKPAKDWRIIVVGTLLHEDALLMDLKDDPTWVFVDLPLADHNLKSYWPMYMTDEEIVSLKKEYEANNRIGEFYRELMNEITPQASATFRAEFFKYYDEADIDLNNDPNVDNVVIVDPAKTGNTQNAYTAIVGVAVNTNTGCIYVRDIINAHLTPDRIYEEAFSMADRLNASVIGYEVTGLNEFIIQPMYNEMYKRGQSYTLVELKARKGEGEYATKSRGKEGRVAALAVYYRTGHVYHNRTCCTPLEAQLLSFPYSKHWDVMDAFAYIIEMMHLGDRYFAPQEEQEFEDLNDDDRFEAEIEKLMAEDDLVYGPLSN